MGHAAVFVLPRHAGIISPPSIMHHPEGTVVRSGLDTRERKDCNHTDICWRTFLIVCENDQTIYFLFCMCKKICYLVSYIYVNINMF